MPSIAFYVSTFQSHAQARTLPSAEYSAPTCTGGEVGAEENGVCGVCAAIMCRMRVRACILQMGACECVQFTNAQQMQEALRVRAQ